MKHKKTTESKNESKANEILERNLFLTQTELLVEKMRADETEKNLFVLETKLLAKEVI